MAEIDIKTETDGPNRWSYEVSVFDHGRHHEFNVTLSWADYDLWCHGRAQPQKVVQAVFEFLLQREPVTSILSRFDCSVVRRYFPEVDKKLPAMI